MCRGKNIKALALDEDIPTPDGWKKMKDIHKGDCVFSVDGSATSVLYESEVFHKPIIDIRIGLNGRRER